MDALIDIARFGHLIGLALGLGLAIHADARFLRALAAPIDAVEIRAMKTIHEQVLVALGVLWLTGIMLLYIRTGFVLSEFAPKLFFKVMVVAVLSVNAVLIGRRVLPMLERAEGFAFTQMPLLVRLQLTLIGAVSVACWISLTALGVFTAFKTMPGGEIMDILRWIFAVPVTGGLALALFAPVLARAGDEVGMARLAWPRLAPRRAARIKGESRVYWPERMRPGTGEDRARPGYRVRWRD